MNRNDRPPSVLVVMLDGLGDRPWPVLGDRTPLAAADTPNLDAMAAKSATGILHSLGPGRAPGTDLAHFVLFGYPASRYPGRAVLEAAGAGMKVPAGQVVAHAIFVKVRKQPDGSLTILERYPGTSEGETARIAAALTPQVNGGLRVALVHIGGEEAIVTVESETGDVQPSADITDTDPHNNGWPVGTVKPLRDAADPAAARATADALTAFLEHAYSALRSHPGMTTTDPLESVFLLLKWTGRPQALPSFREQTGMRASIVSSARIFEGLSDVLGVDHVRLPSRPDLAEDTAMRLAHGAGAIAEGADFVLVHSKAPDVAGHSKDPVAKRDAIAAIDVGLERLDRLSAGGVVLPAGTIVVVTGDHGTPAGTTMIHSGDPVPLAIMAAAAGADGVTSFDERACASGSLGRLLGSDFMPVLLNLRGTARYMGGRLASHTGLHWPDDYETFRVD